MNIVKIRGSRDQGFMKMKKELHDEEEDTCKSVKCNMTCKERSDGY